MREMSSQFKQDSQQPKDIRGGDKKVMKKSLTSILALAMTFSMFSTAALAAEGDATTTADTTAATTADATKTSADFSDLKDLDAATKAKFDALISAGVFDGVAEGKFGLKDEMNRAQFAKVAALIFNLKVDSSLKTSSFKDVKSDDPANGYALPFIEAVKAAGITDGVADGVYDPAGKVTKEQLAAFLIKGLGLAKDAAATPGVTDATVSDWAKGYVALAIQKKLMSNGADGKFGGETNATRDLLVLGSYEAKSQYKGPAFNGKYAIASFKATDANLLVLELNGALTEEAAKTFKVELKKDGSVITSGYKTAWDKDKKVATLTFDSKFLDNKFDVTISGVTNLDDAAKTASVTTTKEKITKIEFLSASDTLPLAWDDKDGGTLLHDVRIDFKASNQYGAKSSLSASNFEIRVSGDSTANPIAGEQAINLKEDDVERNDRVSITILHEDSGVQVNKIFTIGDEAYVTKVEVGDLVNASGTKVDSIDPNGYAYLTVKAYDQYGFRVEDKDILNDSVSVNSNDSDIDFGMSDDDDDAFVDNIVGDNAADLRIRSTEKEAKDITISVIARGGQTVTKVVKVNPARLPASVEFGAYNYTLAEGDKATGDSDLDKKLYLPLVIKDAKGTQLTADQIVDAFYLDEKFDVDDNGVDLAANPIVKSGPYKGMIEISEARKKGSQSVVVTLEDQPNVRATINLYVGEARKADSLKFQTTAPKYVINNTDAEMKIQALDQYGQKFMSDDKYAIKLDVKLTDGAPGTTSYYASHEYNRTKTANTTWTGSGATLKDGNGVSINDSGVFLPVTPKVKLAPTVVGQTYSATVPVTEMDDASYRFYSTAGATKASYSFKATLLEGTKTIDDLTTTFEVLDPMDDKNKLTYEVYLDGGVNNTVLALDDYTSNVTGASYGHTWYQKFVKEARVRAKNSSGETVKFDYAGRIRTVTASDNNVINVAGPNTRWIAGMEAGTAKVNIVYQDLRGDYQTGTLDVTVKNEGPVVSSIVLETTNVSISNSALTATTKNSLYMFDEKLGEKLTVKDQYGTYVADGSPGAKNVRNANTDQFIVQRAFAVDDILPNGDVVKTATTVGKPHNDLLNLTFYLSDIQGTTPANIKIDSKTGQITYTGTGVTSFTANVVAPSGKMGSVGVTVTP
jgi:hypothetical protein